MTIPTKLRLSLCALILLTVSAWWHGYHTADARWTQKDTDSKLEDAKASAKLSEEYRVKEQKLNEHIGTIETRAINDAAQAEAEYRADVERLRNGNGLRIKPALACRAVPNNTATSSNGDEKVQSGLSPEVAERIIGTGAECDQVVLSLDACQAYAESLHQDKEKPLD